MPLFIHRILRVCFFLLLSLAISHFSSAQAASILSIKKQLSGVKSDSSKIKLYDNLAKHYEEIDIDSCFYFLSKSLEFAQKSHNLKAVSLAMYRFAYTYLYISKDETKATDWLIKTINIAKKNNYNDITSKCLQLMGIIAEHQGTGNPLDYYKDAVQYALKSDDITTLGNAYEVISTFSIKNKRYKEAEEPLLKNIKLQEKYDIDSWLSNGLDYCNVLSAQNKKNEAFAFAKELHSKRDKIKKSKGDFVYLNDMGKLEMYLQNYPKAESFFQEALDREVKKSKIDTLHLFFIYMNLEELYLAQKDFQKAYDVSKKNLSVNLWLAQKRQSQDSKLQITKQKAALDLEKKEIEISLLANQKKQQTTFLIVTILVALILVSLLIILQRNKQRIEQQKTELTQLNKTKDKLFSIIAHDLREPMASFKGLLQLIEEEALSQQEFRELSKSLKQNVDNIHAMLENLLLWSLSQMNGIKPHLRKFDIGDSLIETVNFFNDVAKQKRIELRTHIQENLVVFSDENQIQTVIRNLLNNAIKFTPSDGIVEIFGEQNEDQIILKVIDSGKGMTPVELSNLFTKPKISRGTAGEKGTGLGLILCKELVEQNKGEISVSSAVGQGTSFEIRLQKG